MMRWNRLGSALVGILLVGTAMPANQAFGVTPITSLAKLSVGSGEGPEVYGDRVVWNGWDGTDYEIYTWKVGDAQPTQLTDNTTYDGQARVSDGRVVWKGGDGGTSIYTWRAGDAQPTRVNTTPGTEPRVSGDRIVWYGLDDLEIYTWKAGDTQPTQVTDNTALNSYPKVSGDRLVWASALDGQPPAIYTWKVGDPQPTKLADNGYLSYEVEVSGDRVVWTGFDGNDSEIYTWKAGDTQPTKLTDNATRDMELQVSDDRVVWQTIGEIFTWKVGDVQPTHVADDIRGEPTPQVSADRIVWKSWDGNDFEIYTWKAGDAQPTQITDNAKFDATPVVFGDRIVWQSWENGGGDILTTVVGSVGSVGPPNAYASTITPAVGPPDTVFDVAWGCPQESEGTLRVIDTKGQVVGEESHLAMSFLGTPGLISRHRWFQLPKEGTYSAIPTCAGKDLPGLPFTVRVTDQHAALGDSFSSGEGASSFFEGTGDPSDGADHEAVKNQCHRSGTAWAFGIGNRYGYTTKLDACSGAVVGDFYGYNHANVSEVPQLENISATTTNLVTLTLGGNDVGFGDILKRCVMGPLNTTARLDCRDYTFDKDAEKYSKVIQGKIDDLAYAKDAHTLHDVYLEIAKRIALGGRIVVAGYPRFFGNTMNDKIVDPYKGGDAPDFTVCRVGGTSSNVDGYYLDPKDANWLNTVASKLNDTIKSEVSVAQSDLASIGRSDVKIVFVDVDPGFKDHRLCDTKTPWLNGLMISVAKAGPLQISMHPNRDGQDAYASSILKKLT